MHAPALAWKSFEERSPIWFILASLHQAQYVKHSRPSANMCWIKGNNYVLPSTCVKPWAESRPYQKGIWPILQVRNQGEVICPKSTTSKWKSTTSIWLINEVICPKSTTSKRLLLTFKILFLSTPLYSWTKGLDNGLVFSSLFSRWVMSLLWPHGL